MFPIGSTSVSCTATDAQSRTASCSFGVTVTLVPTLTRTTFLAFGDSITLGEVTEPTTMAMGADGFPNFRLVVVPSASYPTQLQNMLSGRYTAQAIAVTNAGKAGEWAADGALRFPDVRRTVRPEVVLLLEGYNDPLATSVGMNEAVAAMESMMKDARLGGARVFLASLTPGRPGRNTIPTSLLLAYNDRLRALAAGEQAVFVDLYAALQSNVGTYIGIDGLHPTEAGYRRMAETFFAAVRADLEVR
jgi:lysophospholipase L1-like esterase